MSSLETLVGIAFIKFNLFLMIVWVAWLATPATALRARVRLWRVATVGSVFVILLSLANPVLQIPWLPNSQKSIVQREVIQIPSRPLDIRSQSLVLKEKEPTIPSGDMESKQAVVNELPAADSTFVGTIPPPQKTLLFSFPSPWQWILIAWGTGLLLLCLRLILQWRYRARLVADSRPVEVWIMELAESVLQSRHLHAGWKTRALFGVSGSSKLPNLRWTKQLNTPAVTGVFRPVILLPESWSKASVDRLRAAIAHELAHIQSGDLFWCAAIELFRAAAWPSPLVWGMATVHRMACERLADFQAWNAIGDRANYRSMLANLAIEMMGRPSQVVLSMVRTPQILDRLTLMENEKTNGRTGMGSTLARAGIFALGLLLGTSVLVPRSLMPQANSEMAEFPQVQEGTGAQAPVGAVPVGAVPVGAAPVGAAPVVAETQEPSSNSKSTVSQSELDQRESIVVVDPDGSLTKNAVYIVARSRTHYQLDTYAVPSVERKALPADSQIRLDMPEDQFLAVWNDKGFCEYAVSQLSKLESLKLQPWCKLTVRLRDGQRPLKGYRISAGLTLTSDGMFQGIRFQNFLVTDDHGNVTFDRLPPGELAIGAEPAFSDPTEVATKRTKYLLLQAGEIQELTLGDQGQAVTGRVVFPEGMERADIAKLEGQLINRTTSDWLTFPIGEDGVFVTANVPEGNCSISIRTLLTDRRREYYGEKSVVLPPESSDLDGRRFVGKIDISEVSRREWETSEIASTPIPIDDPFISQDLVDWVTTTKSGHDEIYVLKSVSGKTIRRLEDDFLNVSFGGSHQNIAIDTTRNRVYILANDATRISRSLFALDRNGKKLYQIKLRTGGYRLALDPETGYFWLLVNSVIGKTDLLVFDPSGNPLHEYAHDDGTAISYSPHDKSIWMAGAKKVVKIDPATGNVAASFALPNGCWNCIHSMPAPDGGVFVFERSHPDMPLSKNRIWYVDSNGIAKANVTLGDFWIKSSGLVQNELWVSGARINRLWSSSPSTFPPFRMVSFDMDLNQLKEMEQPYEFLHANRDGQTAWVRSGEEELQVTYDTDHHLKVLTTGHAH